ncbi:MAG TPA: hypothetical protein VLH15_06140 [Dehalococcoidales bacterium]|nr:hypothetical protein [Dehalococcoidales bacterium]
MATHYTDHLLITDVRKNTELPPIRKDKPGKKSKTKLSEHVVWLDERVIPGSRLYSEAIWFSPGPAEKAAGGEVGMVEHTHPFEEVLAFFGSDFQNPRDLGAELEVILDGEKNVVSRTSLIFIPAGMKHSVSFKAIRNRVFHFSIGASNEFKADVPVGTGKKGARGTAKYIVDKLVPPKVEAPWSPPPPPEAAKGKGGRILFLDSDIVPGGFYTECVWIAPRPANAPKPAPEQLARFKASVKPHAHDFAEVLCFFGTDPEDVTKLNSRIELWINDEKHIITRSTMVYLPAGTLHCPLAFPKVGMPIIHFTSFPEGKIYYNEADSPEDKK